MCGGDTLNSFDADARFGKGFTEGLANYANQAQNGVLGFMEAVGIISPLTAARYSQETHEPGYYVYPSAAYEAGVNAGYSAVPSGVMLATMLMMPGLGEGAGAAGSSVARSELGTLGRSAYRGGAGLAAEANVIKLDFGGGAAAATPAQNWQRAMQQGRQILDAQYAQYGGPNLAYGMAAQRLPSGVGGTGEAYNKLSGQGLYVLTDDAGAVKYIGRGDVPTRIAAHANAPGKDMFSGRILWENNLTKAQAKGLEQRLIDHFGGALRQNPNSPLLNEFRSFAPGNPNAALYRNAVTDELWSETLRRLGL